MNGIGKWAAGARRNATVASLAHEKKTREKREENEGEK